MSERGVPLNIAGKLARIFIESKITAMIMLAVALAIMPASATASMIMAVILDSIKMRASLPAMLSGTPRSLMRTPAHLVAIFQLFGMRGCDLLAGFESGLNLNHAMVGRPAAYHSKARNALPVDHEYSADAGAFHHGVARYHDAAPGSHAKPHLDEAAALQGAALGQINLNQM